MKTRSLLVLAVAVFVPLTGLYAQRVRVRLHEPPPGQLQYEDLWSVELNNTTRETLTTYLHAEVSEATRGPVFRANTNEFRLAPGRRSLRLADVTIRDPWYLPGYELFVRRTGTLPEGSYRYSVAAMPDLGADSGEIVVAPPVRLFLLAPAAGATVNEPHPMFSWSARTVLRGPVTYSLVIAPVLRGQSPQEAIAANRPWFAKTSLATTSFRYPTAARPLVRRQQYAWQVTAMSGRSVVALSEAWQFLTGLSLPDTLASGMEIYFADGFQPNGKVYRCDLGTGTEVPVYTRPSGNLHSFFFAPWNPKEVYFVNANQFKIYKKDVSPGAPAEQVVYTHSTYIRDLAYDAAGRIYFSEATGSSANGRIYRIEKDASVTLYYTAQLSAVDGSWAGDFAFDPDGVLYLSSGNRIPASVYRVEPGTGAVSKIFTHGTEAIAGFSFGPDGLIYYANWGQKLYYLNPATGVNAPVYTNVSHHWMSDVGFMPITGGVKPPPGATTWVMPWGVTSTRLDGIKSTGMVDYTDAMSGILMTNAPFGGSLAFRHGSSPTIPSAAIKYYRWQYRQPGGTWTELTDPVVIYYVKDVPGFPPVFVPYKLGPNPVAGMNLYEFRPPASALPVPPEPGATVYWPGTGFLGDIYGGFWNTEAPGLPPGQYQSKLEVFSPLGVPVTPGPGTFRFVVPNGQHGDTVLTRFAAPAEIDGVGYRFNLWVDNRPCSAFIAVPTMGSSTVADECGMLRYDLADTSPVRIAFRATHPDSFGVWYFSLIRGATLVTNSAAGPVNVKALSGGIYTGDGAGNFAHNYLISALFDPPCSPACREAAYAENLYVYAKATTGNGYRIGRFDASMVRAFGLALNHP